MATKDSEELKSDERYPLGDYSFRIERSSVPGSSNDKIEAICTDKDGHNARKSIQLPSNTQLNGWYVEANGTEATVYATVKVPSGGGGGTVPGDNPFNILICVCAVQHGNGNETYCIHRKRRNNSYDS